MRAAAKGAVVLLVTLPMLAYVAGRLVASPPDPGPRSPVILDGSMSPSPTPTPSPPPRPSGNQPGEPGDGRDEEDDEDDEDDEGVRVVNPTPTRVGEDDGAPDSEGDDHTDDDTDVGDD